MKYGDVALGVECALPRAVEPAGPWARLARWLIRSLGALG